MPNSGCGVSTQFPSVFDVSQLDGWNGFVIYPEGQNDQIGHSVNNAGDVNNDGIADFVIGAPSASSPVGQFNTGTTYIIFGHRELGKNGALELSHLNSSIGIKIYGANNDNIGTTTNAAGDVNGDGIDDFLIGAESRGCYVIFGGSHIGEKEILKLSTLNVTTGFQINPLAGPNAFAASLSKAGDLNADGVGDILIGDIGSLYGKAYVVFGHQGIRNNATLSVSRLNGTNGFVINGEQIGDDTGIALSYIGDVNKDGIDDIIIGAPFYLSGNSYVIFGRTEFKNASFDLTSLNGNNGFILKGNQNLGNGGRSGFALSGGQDINADGISDMFIGAPAASPLGKISAGIGYVVFGSADIGKNGIFNLATLNSTTGLQLNGVTASDNNGYSVRLIKDVNGDGIADMVIGAPFASVDGQSNVGVIYVVFGRKGFGNDTTIELSNLDGTTGFQIQGSSETTEELGQFISGVDDVNADGVADILLGTPFSAFPSGRTYVIFGDIPPVLITNTLRINQAQTITVTSANLNATHFMQDPDKIIFYIGYLSQGIFSFITNPGISITQFTQGQLKEGLVKFTHFGSPIPPSYQVATSSGRFFMSAPQSATIDFHIPPHLVNNSLTITKKNQKLILSTEELYAEDSYDTPSNILFTILGLQNGQFSWMNDNTPILNFTLQDVIGRSVVFTATDKQPFYLVSVSDSRTVAPLQEPQIHFQVSSLSPGNTTNNTTTNTLVGALVGTVGFFAIGLGAVSYFRYDAREKLNRATSTMGDGLEQTSNFREKVFSPMMRALYSRIKISGLLGYLNNQAAKTFVDAMHTLLDELQKQHINLDFETTSLDYQKQLFDEIAKKIRAHCLPLQPFPCITSFFKAEIQPAQIKEKAKVIATSIAVPTVAFIDETMDGPMIRNS